MFYSDVLLTKGKGSLGIFWLAATLGGQKQNRKITRKAVIAVDFAKACELIAEPPEPLALRLSGNLLVGVARVYNQSYDFFYTDVTSLHSNLRRSLISDFANTPTGEGGGGGLDLPGGGRSKLDQITFGGTDVAWESGLELLFTPIDWRNPLGPARTRRSSTKLESLSSNVAEDEEEEYDSEEESDEDGLGLGRKGSRTTHTPDLCSQTRNNINLPNHSSQRTPEYGIGLDDGFNNFQEMDLGLDLPGVDYDPSSGPSRPGFELPEFNDNGDFGIPIQFSPFEQLPGEDGQPQDQFGNPRTPGQQPETPAKSAKKRRRLGSEESLDDETEQVEDELEVVKPKKKGRKLQFDADIELGNEDDYEARQRYAELMDTERRVLLAREQDKEVEKMATAMVDGAGMWLDFFDPEMKSFFATLSAHGKFKWELAVAAHKTGKKQPSPNPPEYQEITNEYPLQLYGQEGDPFGYGNGEVYQEQYQDFVVPLREDGRKGTEDIEQARRDSQYSQRSGMGGLPWDDVSFSDMGGDNSFTTPGSLRVSLMTPQEARIRQSSKLSSGPGTGSTRRRERSNSVLAPHGTEGVAMLYGGDDLELPDHENLELMEDVPVVTGAFAPRMLASLEKQCRDFLTYVEVTTVRTGMEELSLDDLVPETATKRIASTAFYNCLTLATKRMLNLNQRRHWGDITVRISSDL